MRRAAVSTVSRLSLNSRVRQDKCCRDGDDDPSHKLLLSYLLCFFSESGSDLVSQRDMTSAISMLFFSSIAMWPLP